MADVGPFEFSALPAVSSFPLGSNLSRARLHNVWMVKRFDSVNLGPSLHAKSGSHGSEVRKSFAVL
ncbi:MAG: hypothetical protein ACI8UO_001492 [Verrucomicrobiales bacterium]|jgi:hypothetical protein